jgi:hypothetical protein
MRLEGIKTPCRCQDEKCDGQRLTQLHLYARTDGDVDMLQALFDALIQNAAEPIQSTDVVVSPETILPVLERAKIAAAKSN